VIDRMSQGRGYRRREDEKQIPWVPRTKLGSMVSEGKITSLEEIFQQGWKIREPEMVKKLVPDLTSEVVYVGIVQKQTDAGELTRFGAVVAVGNGKGWFVGDRQGHERLAPQHHPRQAGVRQLGVQVRDGPLSPLPNHRQSRQRDGRAPTRSAFTRKSRGSRADEPPGARGSQGRLGQDLRLDEYPLIARQRGLRRVLKVAWTQRLAWVFGGKILGKLLVVNLHGLINVPSGTRATLIQLGIGKRFAATVVGDDVISKGSVHLCKDYVAWNALDVDLLTTLLKSRGRVSNSKTLDDQALEALGFKSHAELAQEIMKDDASRLSSKGLKPFFGLSPPKGGFKRSSRRAFRQGGILGENPLLAEIVRRMI
jgi:large subunit ribosomal protein L30